MIGYSFLAGCLIGILFGQCANKVGDSAKVGP
jgi:hypothetical protein